MRRTKGFALLVGVVLLGSTLGGCTPQPWASEPISVNAAGTGTGNARSYGPSVSADGTKVAFTSNANDLGPRDDTRPDDPAPGLFDEQRDVYLRDLTTGTTTLVSVNAAGTNSGNNRSYGPVVSPDGTKVAFSSWANDLGPTDVGTLFDSDIYVRDLVTGVTELVSANAAGTDGIGGTDIAFSPDGTKVAFWTGGNGYGPTDTNDAYDVYLRDLVTDTTTLVSTNTSGTDSGNALSWNHEFSPDGTSLVFDSHASDLGSPDSNGLGDIYVRDLGTGTTTLVSVNAAGTATGNGHSHLPRYSPDGTKIAFHSSSSDLGAVDTNENGDLYVRDLVTDVTSLVSVNAGGTDSGNGYSYEPVFSPDSTQIAFISDANDLGSPDSNGLGDVYVRDLDTGTTSLVSSNAAGTDSGNANSTLPVFSPDGRRIAFSSSADDLGPTDHDRSTNSSDDVDVYVRDLDLGLSTLVSTNEGHIDSSNGVSEGAAFLPDGRILLTSKGSDLGTADSNDDFDIYMATYRAADLSVSLDATPEPVASGADLTYELRAGNTGPDQAESVEAALLLPEGTTFVDAATTAGSCSVPTPEQPRLVRCQVGELDDGSDLTVTVHATVTAPNGTTLTAFGGVSSTTVDVLGGDNAAAAVSSVVAP